MRDFYDIYILEQLHGNTLNPQTLYDALLVTTHKCGTERYLTDAKGVLDEVKSSSVMQKFWESYHRKFSYVADLEWNIIMGWFVVYMRSVKRNRAYENTLSLL